MRYAIIAATALSALAFTACGDDEYYDINPSAVPAEVKDSFKEMYPTAQWVEWDSYNSYYIADFTLAGFDTEAWYSPDGQWAMTETDYDSNIYYLPMAMQDAFTDSQYATWQVDDVSLYQRVADTFCTIDVEAPGQGDMTIYIDNTGAIVNVTPDVDAAILPTTIIAAL